MRVKWENKSFTVNLINCENTGNYRTETPDVFFKGKVIHYRINLWGQTFLLVACDDKVIREVEYNKVEIIN